jgi:hypothetical protein
LGEVIDFRAAYLESIRGESEQEILQRRFIVSDLRSISGQMATMERIVADMEESLRATSRMLEGYTQVLRNGRRRQQRIMKVIEAVEATMGR